MHRPYAVIQATEGRDIAYRFENLSDAAAFVREHWVSNPREDNGPGMLSAIHFRTKFGDFKLSGFTLRQIGRAFVEDGEPRFQFRRIEPIVPSMDDFEREQIDGDIGGES